MYEKIQLALGEFIHVGGVLVIVIALVSVLTGLVRTYIPQEELQKKLARQGRFGSVVGALLGIPTPFCSASMVPVSMGMVEMGAPFSMVFAFLISAPLANFVVVSLILGVFGWKVALTYFLIVFIGAVVIGSIVGNTSLCREVKKIDLSASCSPCCGKASEKQECGTSNSSICGEVSENVLCEAVTDTSCNGGIQSTDCCCGTPTASCDSVPEISGAGCCTSKSQDSESTSRLRNAMLFAIALFKRIIPYVLLGAAISAVCAFFVPDAWVERYLGSNNPAAIPLAAFIGVPLYLRIEMALPLLKILITKGMGMGAAMALVIGGTGASLPEIAIISSMLKPKAIMAFVASILSLGIIGGFIFWLLF